MIYIDYLCVMKVLVGCEESQAVCIAFRKKGHEAYSCDLQECSGGHPEWHLQMDVFEAIKLKKWDLGIFHPDCTFLTNCGIGYFNEKRYGQKAIDRKIKRIDAFDFFMKLYNSDIDKICVENPTGWVNSHFRKPDQIIHPYYFGDNQLKRTCLWLKNLPKLIHSRTDNLFEQKTHIPHPEPTYIDVRRPGTYYKGGEPKKRYFVEAISGNTPESKKIRSKTFPGIAKAMADQWG